MFGVNCQDFVNIMTSLEKGSDKGVDHRLPSDIAWAKFCKKEAEQFRAQVEGNNPSQGEGSVRMIIGGLRAAVTRARVFTSRLTI